MKIDTEIRHVTKPGANLFLELGFTPDEAKRLQAASRKQIDATRLLKRQLMEELSVWIAKHHLKQAEAAEILVVSRPRVSDVVNKKTASSPSIRPWKCSAGSASRSSWQSVDQSMTGGEVVGNHVSGEAASWSQAHSFQSAIRPCCSPSGAAW